MFNEIIIPHRNRNEFLAWTLWSIQVSADVTGVTDYRVTVIDADSRARPWPRVPRERVIVSTEPMRVFNKSRLLNRGIRLADGDVITVLDADMLVGPRWLEGVQALADPGIHRLCYRVRKCSPPRYRQFVDARNPLKAYRRLFADYDHFELEHEAWRHHNRVNEEMGPPYQPFGNSQGSMTREHFGDLRFDERYAGHGWEDIEFLRRVERKWATRDEVGRTISGYRGAINTDPAYCLLHLPHPKDDGPEWGNPRYGQEQFELYQSETDWKAYPWERP